MKYNTMKGTNVFQNIIKNMHYKFDHFTRLLYKQARDIACEKRIAFVRAVSENVFDTSESKSYNCFSPSETAVKKIAQHFIDFKSCVSVYLQSSNFFMP